ncbi:PTS sugar transporter subunit IIA [Oceanobacillus locisalsi]|uniref:PTS sugar transporter subunit IIA n=1 Tax=Oceanobacillus locisalsi TaxID=546107 RepID=A0ABW3NBZ6_9BACI
MNNYLDKELILLNSRADSTPAIFEEIGSVMIKQGYANSDYVEGLKAREKEFPTGVPTGVIGVALPHTDASYVNDSKIGLMTLENPVSFRIMGSDSDEIEVKVVFLLGCSDGEEHIQVLQKIVELVQQQAFLDQLLQLETVDEAYQLLEANLDL